MLAAVGIPLIPALAIIQNDECFQIESCHTYEMTTYRRTKMKVLQGPSPTPSALPQRRTANTI